MDEVETEVVAEETETETNDILRQRTRIKELEAENKELRNTTMRGAFEKAGFDPADGVGKLLFKEYKGDPVPEKVAEYAKAEYNLDSAVAQPQATEQGEFEQRLDTIQTASVSVAPSDIMDQITAAEAAGDFATALSLKTQLVPKPQ